MENVLFEHADRDGDLLTVSKWGNSLAIRSLDGGKTYGVTVAVHPKDEERLFRVLLERHNARTGDDIFPPQARTGEVGEWTLSLLEGLQTQVCSLKENAIKEMKRLSDLKAALLGHECEDAERRKLLGACNTLEAQRLSNLQEAFVAHEHHCGRSPQ